MQDEVLSRCLSAAPAHASAIHRLFDISPLFASLMRGLDADEYDEVFRAPAACRLPDAGESWCPAMAADEEDCLAALRQIKRRGLARVIWWELGLGGDVLVSATSLSRLAEQLIHGALEMAVGLLTPRFGMVPDGRFCVIGLGKLGGEELNLGSDVDLLFLWQSEATKTTGGRRSLNAAAYFQHLARELIRLLAEHTADGQVWPVDMRLRPGSDGAPICLPLDTALMHYQEYGQTWERAMLIKARPVAGDTRLGEAFIAGIQPFVYRRYLDYTTVQALADMKRRINAQAGHRAIGPGFDVKRGQGGIREIEFYIQSLQLLHGGRRPVLRCRPSMQALSALADAELVARDQAGVLADAYRFWRRIEHALQARHGEQTHALPEDYDAYLARALNLDDVVQCMQGHVTTVQACFREQFGMLSDGAEEAWLDQDAETWQRRLAGVDAEACRRICRALHDICAFREQGLLPERCHRQIASIVDAAMRAWEGDANRVHALESLAALFRRIAGRATWFDLLDHHEGARRWLFDVLSASRYIAGHVVADPSWLEWPLESGRGSARMERLHRELATLSTTGLDDEQYLATLARLVSQSRLTAAMTVAADEQNPLVIGAWLARTADIATQAIQGLSLRQLGLPADFPFVCLAMGKHGSREMGMVSDLDMVFVLVHESPEGTGPGGKSYREWAQRLGRRIIHHLTTPAPYGGDYTFDARLRPSGQSGVLVTTLAAFVDYQMHAAQTWEHQALCRARAVSGPEVARRQVQEAVDAVLRQPRDAHALARDVLDMRARMLEHLGSRSSAIINLKHDAGGLVDIEFLAQYARLCFGGEHTGMAETLHALPVSAPARWRRLGGRLADSYMDYRQMENALRVQLWQSIGKLSADERAPEWETMRRHAPISSPEELKARMCWVREQFLSLLNEAEEK